MKIVHVINYFQHQLGYQEYFIAKEQIKAGHEVYIITSNKYFPFPDYDNTVKPILGEREFMPKNEMVEGINVIRLMGKYEQPGRRIWLTGLMKNIIKIKPDYILSHGEETYSTFILSAIKVFFNWKLVVDSHSHNHENRHLKKGIKTIVLQFLTRLIVLRRKSIKIAATTEWNKQYLIKTYNLKDCDVTLIPNGSEVERFKPDINLKKSRREKYRIQQSKVIILYTGKISKEKNPLAIIEAIKNDLSRLNILLLLIGNIQEDYKEYFKFYYRKFGNYIMQLPAAANSEIHNFYIMSDIACWPNQSSMSAIDAISSGLPIIVVSDLKERLAYNNGIGIDFNDITTLRSALLTLIENESLRENMGINSRMFAEKQLNWKSTSEKFIALTET